jgi:hypothetical protein
VTAPAAQRFSLIRNAYIVMMMMNNDKHNTRTSGTTLSFSVVIILLEVAVCVSVGGITAHAVAMLHTPAGLYLVGIYWWRAILSLYM